MRQPVSALLHQPIAAHPATLPCPVNSFPGQYLNTGGIYQGPNATPSPLELQLRGHYPCAMRDYRGRTLGLQSIGPYGLPRTVVPMAGHRRTVSFRAMPGARQGFGQGSTSVRIDQRGPSVRYDRGGKSDTSTRYLGAFGQVAARERLNEQLRASIYERPSTQQPYERALAALGANPNLKGVLAAQRNLDQIGRGQGVLHQTTRSCGFPVSKGDMTPRGGIFDGPSILPGGVCTFMEPRPPLVMEKIMQPQRVVPTDAPEQRAVPIVGWPLTPSPTLARYAKPITRSTHDATFQTGPITRVARSLPITSGPSPMTPMPIEGFGRVGPDGLGRYR